MKCSRSTVCALTLALMVVNGVPAQYQPTPMTQPRNYTDYYQKHIQSFQRPPTNVRTYTIDKYYYRNPSISPYLNLTRRHGPAVNNYYQYVLPELQRRQQAAAKPGALPYTLPAHSYPAVGPIHTSKPAVTPPGVGGMSNYMKHNYNWYGGVKK